MAQLWINCARLGLDANRVVTMRLMGMVGGWTVSDTENADMLSEKLPAFTEAYLSALLAALSGQTPDRVMQAMIDPLSDRAALNRERLSQSGPARFGPRAAPTLH
ncbi:MAG: antifreeze protein [Rhodobacteraceae bacterium]|nr:antifreeze protein [Paracoccaceae bacterium]